MSQQNNVKLDKTSVSEINKGISEAIDKNNKSILKEFKDFSKDMFKNFSKLTDSALTSKNLNDAPKSKREDSFIQMNLLNDEYKRSNNKMTDILSSGFKDLSKLLKKQNDSGVTNITNVTNVNNNFKNKKTKFTMAPPQHNVISETYGTPNPIEVEGANGSNGLSGLVGRDKKKSELTNENDMTKFSKLLKASNGYLKRIWNKIDLIKVKHNEQDMNGNNLLKGLFGIGAGALLMGFGAHLGGKYHGTIHAIGKIVYHLSRRVPQMILDSIHDRMKAVSGAMNTVLAKMGFAKTSKATKVDASKAKALAKDTIADSNKKLKNINDSINAHEAKLKRLNETSTSGKTKKIRDKAFKDAKKVSASIDGLKANQAKYINNINKSQDFLNSQKLLSRAKKSALAPFKAVSDFFGEAKAGGAKTLNIFKTSGKAAGVKALSKGAGKSLLKGAFAGVKGIFKTVFSKIPFIGLFMDLNSAVKRFGRGQYLRALIDVISGVASFVPGIGTAVSIGASLLNAYLDYKWEDEVVPKDRQNLSFGESISKGVSDLKSKLFGKTKEAGKAIGVNTGDDGLSVVNDSKTGSGVRTNPNQIDDGYSRLRNADSDFLRVDRRDKETSAYQTNSIFETHKQTTEIEKQTKVMEELTNMLRGQQYDRMGTASKAMNGGIN